jgi:hypothetical protein
LLRSRRLGILAGVVAAGVLAGAGAAFAATSSPGHPAAQPTASPSSPASPSQLKPAAPWRALHGKPFLFGPGFGPGFLGGLFGAVHGTAVVPKAGGGYQTIAFQNGKVTAVSASSITLRSADGYSRTYQVTSSTLVNAQRDGISSIKAGNTVSVQATVSGTTATAAQIIDVSLLQQGLHSFFGINPGANVRMSIP